MEITLPTIAAIIFISGLIAAQLRYGQTRSISALFDELEEDEKARSWWFIAWQAAFVLPVALTLQSYFFAAAAMAIIASALSGDTEEHRIIMRNHTATAVLGMVLGMLGIIEIGHPAYAVLGGVLVGLIYLVRLKNRTYWAETLIMMWIVGAVYLSNLGIILFPEVNEVIQNFLNTKF